VLGFKEGGKGRMGQEREGKARRGDARCELCAEVVLTIDV